MELCKETLEEHIHSRNNDKDLQKSINDQNYTFENKFYFKNLKIMLEITKALKHLHLKENIIHRDLKPQNIFFSFENVIKIGDFGLATDFYNEKYLNFNNNDSIKNKRKTSTESNATQSENTNNNKLINYNLNNNFNYSISNPSGTNENTICFHTKNIGTLLYASPEQLNENFYDYKSDIFSLGLIFYELLCPFRTSMEKKLRFQELKSGKIIDFVKEQNKTISNMLLNMTDNDPNKRPHTLEIIEIIKEEIDRIKIMRYPHELEDEIIKIKKCSSNYTSKNSSNNNSTNSDFITEESSSIINYNKQTTNKCINDKSCTYFQDEDSKIIKDKSNFNKINNKSNFSNLIHSANDSFHLISNIRSDINNLQINKSNNLVLNGDKQNINEKYNCKCSKNSFNFNINNLMDNNDILNFNSNYFMVYDNNNNLIEQQRPRSTGIFHHEILSNSGIYIKICFYEGDHIPAPDSHEIKAVSYKDYMNSIHIKKYLKIIKNKLMIFSDEKSKKADQIYEMDDCEIIYDNDFENENKPEYQIFIVHPYLKNISLYFNKYSEYFNFVEFLSNNQN